MKKLTEALNNYLSKKAYVWADSTKISASARLTKLLPILVSFKAEDLWDYMEDNDMKPYARVTTWIQVINFVDSFSEVNPYKIFREEKSRFFKNAYQRKELKVSYEEARNRIMSIEDSGIRTKALTLLRSGMRLSESYTYDKGYIIGKGGKRRKVFGDIPEESSKVNKNRFVYELKKVKLTPHMLRKLAASKFVELGMKEADLLKVMGWSSMQTASIYLQPKNDEMLDEMIRSIG